MRENNAYLQRKIATLSTAEINVMLLNRAIFCLEKAREACEGKDFQAYHDHAQKVVKIIVAMANALPEYAKDDLYDQLSAFFKMILQLMIQLNLKHDLALANDIIAMLASNRDAWQHLVQNASSESSNPVSSTDLGIDRRT